MIGGTAERERISSSVSNSRSFEIDDLVGVQPAVLLAAPLEGCVAQRVGRGVGQGLALGVEDERRMGDDQVGKGEGRLRTGRYLPQTVEA